MEILDKNFIKELTDEFYELHCAIAKKFIGKEELFLNKYPSAYEKAKSESQGIDLDLFIKFTNFLIENGIILQTKDKALQKELHEYKNVLLRMEENQKLILSEQQKILDKKNAIYSLKKSMVLLLCSIIPVKKYRADIRRVALKSKTS